MVVFENRTGVRNVGTVVAAFVVAGILIVYQYHDLWLGLGVTIGMAALSFVVIVVAFRLTTRDHLAKLSLEGDRFEAERLAMFGHGKTFSFAVRDASDWQWQGKQTGGQADANPGFMLGGTRYTLPTSNARICDIAAMQAAVAKAAEQSSIQAG